MSAARKPVSVLVTGATGLVGSHVVAHLAELGHRVTALVRPTSDTRALEPLAGTGRIRIARAELDDRAALLAAMAGADVVVHAAGMVDPLGRADEIRAVNVEGTRACLEAAEASGVTQFVHISSLSVITGQRDQFGVDERAPIRHSGETYADSKADAEILVMRERPGQRLYVTALRPGFIYGPGERAWLPRLVESLAAGRVALVDGGTKETNVIFVGNLCRAVALSLLNPRAYGQAFNLTDGQRVTKKELFDAVADGLGLPRPTRVVPARAARLVCEAVSTVAPFLPLATRRKLARFSRAAFRLVGVNQGFAIGKAERGLGYVDRIPFAEGMRRTLASHRDGPAAPPAVAGRPPNRFPLDGVRSGAAAFLVDYGQRHAHPVNAGLHVIGVPMAVAGVVQICRKRVVSGASLFAGGYLLQYLGHRAQGNEVGEVILIRSLWRRLSGRGR